MLEDLKKLREITGAGIVDCQKALKEAEGNLDKAIEILRKKGEAKAAKKSGRETKEGMVWAETDEEQKKVYLVKLLCETDFVARNSDFQDFVRQMARYGLEKGSAADFFAERKNELVLKLGENITLGEEKFLSGEFVSSYIHANKAVAGALVFNKKIDSDLAFSLAMQIVAMNPLYLSPEEVPEEEKEKEKDIYREQLSREGKPAEIIEKILEGKLNKYYQEVCLLKQSYIKEDKKSVEQVLRESDPEAKIEKFIRFSL